MAKNNIIQVGGELKSIAYDGIVVDAKAVYDYTLDKTQEDINSENSLQEIAGNYTTDSTSTVITTQNDNIDTYLDVYFADLNYFTLHPNESIEVTASDSNSTVYIIDKVGRANIITGVTYNDVLASGTGEATYHNDTNDIVEVKVGLSEASTEYDYIIHTFGVPKEALRPDVQDILEDVSGKQDILVSGTNIKTINNQSLLGSGNITIEVDGSDDGITEAYTVVDAGTLTQTGGQYNITSAIITAINSAYNSGRIPILTATLSNDSNVKFTSLISKSSDNRFFGEFHTSSNRYYFSSLTYSQLATGVISAEVNVNESNLKTVNGNSLLGEGNVLVGTYTKPTEGIPTSDLASAIQTSLGKADTSYQKPSSGIPTSDMTTSVQTSIGKAESAVQYEESIDSYNGTTNTPITINGNTYYTTNSVYIINPGDAIRYTCESNNHATYLINAGVTPKTLLQESNYGEVRYTNETDDVIQVQGACISNNDNFYVQITKPGLVSLQNTKVSKMPFTSLDGSQISTLSTQINRLYYINNVSTLTITLPGVTGTDTNYVQNIEFIVETVSSGSVMVNFGPTNSVKIMGYESLTNATTYRFSAMCVANMWYITMNIIDAPTK